MRHEKRKRGPPSEPDLSVELSPVAGSTPTLDAYRAGSVAVPQRTTYGRKFGGRWIEHTMNWKLAKYEREKAQKDRRARRRNKRRDDESEG